jgi:hypothetical protein
MTKTQCKDIVLYAACNITPRIIAIQNSATNPFTVTFNNATVGTNTSWEWNFGDGSPLVTTSNAVRTYTMAGTYTVCLTVNKGQNYCEAKVCMPVYVGTGNCTIPTASNMMSGENGQEMPSHLTIIDEHVKYYDSEKVKGLEPSAYPNPTNNNITIVLGKNAYFENRVSVSNMHWQELMKLTADKGTGQVVMDISDFPTGLYLVTIRTNEGKLTTLKIMKE